MPHHSLKADKIIATIGLLSSRIEERFPGAGLAGVCRELKLLVERASSVTEQARRPILVLRLVTAILVALVFAGLAVTIYGLAVPEEAVTFPEFVLLLEAGINDLVLIGIGIFFMVSLERRLKRRRMLGAIDELRSVAHIVDMHQLTKDPSHKVHRVADTPSSPRRTLSKPDLARYLDYCSEMLSLTGKIAALYAEGFDDAAVLAAVSEVEALATGMSGKIWQKLVILEGTPDEKHA